MRCAGILLLIALFVLGGPTPVRAQTADALLKEARAALEKGKTDDALKLSEQAIKLEPKNAQAYLLRGVAYAALQKHPEAVTDFDKVIDLDPKIAAAYQQRGSEHVQLGHITESIKDFDKYLEMRPEGAPRHWQRGISYYYAGRFKEGGKQFGAYEQVDSNDVENAVWGYLCMARVDGRDKARQAMQKVGFDRRVPMMQVYALFSGKAKPADVLAAAEAGEVSAKDRTLRLFYAHLYLGLYYESEGEAKKALEHIAKAAKEYKIDGHYMWDVARVHYELRSKENKSK
jgi:lipoprotein NlpI